MKNFQILLILIIITLGYNTFAQNCLLVKPTKVTRKKKVENWWFLNDQIYVKLTASTGNKTSNIYTFSSNGQTQTINEIREYPVHGSNWFFNAGDKIEIWEDNILSDTRILSHTFTNADKNPSVLSKENSNYKISISKACINYH